MILEAVKDIDDNAIVLILTLGYALNLNSSFRNFLNKCLLQLS